LRSRIQHCFLAAAGLSSNSDEVDSAVSGGFGDFHDEGSGGLRSGIQHCFSAAAGPKHQHFGEDLSGFTDSLNCSYGIVSDFCSKSALKTPSVGKKKVFLVENSNYLRAICINRRHTLDMSGPVTFIESSQLSKFMQCCNGSVAVFSYLPDDTPWWLGIVRGIFPMNIPPAIDLFEWVGPLQCFGTPKFASIHEIKCWSEISAHFLLREFNANDIEFIFVNQIRGIPIGNSPISPSTRNKSDGGIQCSSSGPDVFSPQIQSPFQNHARVTFKFDRLKLKETSFQQSNIYVRSK